MTPALSVAARVQVAIRSSWVASAGPGRRRAVTDCVEAALVDLWDEVAPPSGTALAAVGSLARRELGPRSDLDLVLLHDGRRRAEASELAERLWYPLWDAGVKLDHSVRTPAECVGVAGRKLSAAVGLLDLRVLAGDAALVATTLTALLRAWRTGARRRLPELLAALEERHAAQGDAAYLLEPDLKEARGGLRDATVLHALAATWLTGALPGSVRESHQRLLDVRDALHVTSGRALDRLLAADTADVARRLGYGEPEQGGPDALHRAVSFAARQIGHAVDLSARAALRALPTRRSSFPRARAPRYSPAPYGLIIADGEVSLDSSTSASEPYAGLQAAALAASRGLVLSPVTIANLATHAPALPRPWPVPPREALLKLLSCGPAVLPVWEALDLANCVGRWIPEWELVRALPQHHPLHRHTVDRHSVQAVAEAAPALTSVQRPDLLLLAALFHDLGKGLNGGVRHAEVGAPVARTAVLGLGLPDHDAAVVEGLVRHHLTLAELAIQRDHTDPATLDTLANAVAGSRELLALLRALTEADAKAAAPAAWSPWRAALINGLADRADRWLAGDAERAAAPAVVDPGLVPAVNLDGRPQVVVVVQSTPGGLALLVAARDRLGLFGDTAGLLAGHGVAVHSAVLSTVEGVATGQWHTTVLRRDDLPDPAYLVQQLQRLESGDSRVLATLARRERRVPPQPAAPHVELLAKASSRASVVEVRVGDRPGLLYALGRALAAERCRVASAHISTIAGQAIDTFYLTEADGRPLADVRAARVRQVLHAAAGGLDLTAGFDRSG